MRPDLEGGSELSANGVRQDSFGLARENPAERPTRRWIEDNLKGFLESVLGEMRPTRLAMSLARHGLRGGGIRDSHVGDR